MDNKENNKNCNGEDTGHIIIESLKILITKSTEQTNDNNKLSTK